MDGFRGYKKILIATTLAGLFAAVSASEASAQYRYRRGLPGAPTATGVVGGFPMGAFFAGVFKPRYYPQTRSHEAPPMRCWWQREDVWNGYDYVPNRVRVCQ